MLILVLSDKQNVNTLLKGLHVDLEMIVDNASLMTEIRVVAQLLRVHFLLDR